MDDLHCGEWEVAAQAAKRLRNAPGETVTQALAAALDAHDTAISAAATESLILRSEPSTVDRLWQALTTLDDDVTDHMWDVIRSLPNEAVSQALERRSEEQS